MSIFSIFQKPKKNNKASSVQPTGEVVKQTVGNTILFSGSKTLKLDETTTSIASVFTNLLTFWRSSEELATESSISSIAYITDIHHYGKKAASTYKSFCTNDIEIEGKLSDELKKEIETYLSKLVPRSGKSGMYALQSYFVKAVLQQGGIAYWIDLSNNALNELEFRLIDIPFSSIKPIFDKQTNSTKYKTDKINLSAINEGLTEEEKFKFESDLEQFQLFFFDIDYQTKKPIPFFSSATEVIYTESLFQRLIRALVEKLALLKHAHFKLTEPEEKNPIRGMGLAFESDEAQNESSEVKKASEEIRKQISNPTGQIVKNPDTKNNYMFVQGASITDENVELNTYSTLEHAAIKPLEDAVEKPLSAALHVPAQFLGLSQSRTETQFSIDVELFLEQESEIRGFMAGILTDLVEFKYRVLNQTLPTDFKVTIKPSEVVRAELIAKAEKTKAETINLKLQNLKLKMDTGYKVTEKEITDLGFDASVFNAPITVGGNTP